MEYQSEYNYNSDKDEEENGDKADDVIEVYFKFLNEDFWDNTSVEKMKDVRDHLHRNGVNLRHIGELRSIALRRFYMSKNIDWYTHWNQDFLFKITGISYAFAGNWSLNADG